LQLRDGVGSLRWIRVVGGARNVISDLGGHGQSENRGDANQGWQTQNSIHSDAIRADFYISVTRATIGYRRNIIVWFGVALSAEANIRLAASLRK
jgi:hypothetical protein